MLRRLYRMKRIVRSIVLCFTRAASLNLWLGTDWTERFVTGERNELYRAREQRINDGANVSSTNEPFDRRITGAPRRSIGNSFEEAHRMVAPHCHPLQSRNISIEFLLVVQTFEPSAKILHGFCFYSKHATIFIDLEISRTNFRIFSVSGFK